MLLAIQSSMILEMRFMQETEVINQLQLQFPHVLDLTSNLLSVNSSKTEFLLSWPAIWSTFRRTIKQLV